MTFGTCRPVRDVAAFLDGKSFDGSRAAMFENLRQDSGLLAQSDQLGWKGQIP
ncbi:hypothetical protein J4558_00805 [Leptolyngbya sp. 15MV]|nr:hypothetical protein J4558_00805 [Leptolyngbya sp. 15MV]